jgi:hypothetical protein
LIPTPTAADSRNGANLTARRREGSTGNPGMTLVDFVRLWPTPRANENEQGLQAVAAVRNGSSWKGQGRGATLATAVRAFPTATAADAKAVKSHGRGTETNPSLCYHATDGSPGKLNPTWVEWLMGFPPEWTVCGASATRSSPRSPKSSGGPS